MGRETTERFNSLGRQIPLYYKASLPLLNSGLCFCFTITVISGLFTMDMISSDFLH